MQKNRKPASRRKAALNRLNSLQQKSCQAFGRDWTDGQKYIMIKEKFRKDRGVKGFDKTFTLFVPWKGMVKNYGAAHVCNGSKKGVHG